MEGLNAARLKYQTTLDLAVTGDRGAIENLVASSDAFLKCARELAASEDELILNLLAIKRIY